MKNIIKNTWHLNLLIGLRFFGLFVVISVLSAYAYSLDGASASLVSLAVGGYAFTQAIFQVPFGVLSDKVNRRFALILGLVVFAIGSVIAGLASNIYLLLLGRFLQGAGAIGSVVSAMISDFTKEEQRAHAMASMGMLIAFSFVSAMIFGPIFAGYLGMHNLFYFVASLAVLSIFIVLIFIPEPAKIKYNFEKESSKITDIFKDKDLTKMYITFLFHSSTMATAFFLIPVLLKNRFQLEVVEFWKIYLPAVIFGMLSMIPSAIFGEKYGKGKEVFLLAIFITALSFLLMEYSYSLLIFALAVVLFFVGFNMFEPLLQSYVSKFAKAHQKGAALGVANTFSYLGMGLGALFSGKIFEIYGLFGVVMFTLFVSLLWALWIAKMRNPKARQVLYLKHDAFDPEKINTLNKTNGIIDSYINETEKVLVIKYDKDLISEKEIKKLIAY